MAKDLFGYPIAVGDYVAVAFREGNWCKMRFGKIVEVFEGSVYSYVERKHELVPDAKMRLAWYEDNKWSLSSGRVDTDASRIVKLKLPEHIQPFA